MARGQPGFGQTICDWMSAVKQCFSNGKALSFA